MHLLPGLLALTSITGVASPVTTIEYDFKTEISLVNHSPTIGNAHLGPRSTDRTFAMSHVSPVVKLSDEDGRTTYFGGFQSSPVNTRLVPKLSDIVALIVGTIEDEKLVVDDSQPYTPRTNGKPERFIQSALREWAYESVYRGSAHRTKLLSRWLHRHNWHRPHDGIGALPPISRLDLPVSNLLALHI